MCVCVCVCVCLCVCVCAYPDEHETTLRRCLADELGGGHLLREFVVDQLKSISWSIMHVLLANIPCKEIISSNPDQLYEVYVYVYILCSCCYCSLAVWLLGVFIGFCITRSHSLSLSLSRRHMSFFVIIYLYITECSSHTHTDKLFYVCMHVGMLYHNRASSYGIASFKDDKKNQTMVFYCAVTRSKEF